LRLSLSVAWSPAIRTRIGDGTVGRKEPVGS